MAKAPENQSFIDMFATLGRDLKLPNVDVEKIMEHHRKNLEALEKSAQAASHGATALMERQRSIMQDALHQVSEMVGQFHASGDPQEMMKRQAEFARKSFETAVKNAGEMAELARKSGSESIEILRQRIKDSMEEVRGAYEKRK